MLTLKKQNFQSYNGKYAPNCEVILSKKGEGFDNLGKVLLHVNEVREGMELVL